MADQLEQQLRDELRGVAASANPPADAWERFTRRVGSTPVRAAAPAPPTRLVLLDPETGDVIDGHRGEAASEFIVQADDTPSRSRGRLLLGAVAAMAALTAAGVVVASRDGGDDGSVSQQTDAVGTQADSGVDG
jgi:hypothetical protein